MGTVLGRGVPDLMAPVAEEAPAVVPPDKDEVVIDPDQYESPPGLPVRAEPPSPAMAAAAVTPQRRRSERLESMRRVRTRTVTRGDLDRAPGCECRESARSIFEFFVPLFCRFSVGCSLGLRSVRHLPASRDLHVFTYVAIASALVAYGRVCRGRG